MRILIVEDEVKMSGYLQQALKEHGYVVDLAFTGNEALDWTSTTDYDLIILDVMLPELDGFSVCKMMRNKGIETTILMLTARDTIDDRVMGLDSGADDYLVKPFSLKELLARIRALMRRTAKNQSKRTEIRVNDLTLDMKTRVVMRASKLIELTNKEFAILSCLMREPGRVYTRSEISDSVWSYDEFNQSNVVDVYIRNLRSKIDDPFDIKLIQTVRGVGYKIAPKSTE